MVDVTFLSGFGAADPSTYFNISHEFARTLRSGATQAFFSDRTIYDSTLFTTQTDTSYLGHVIVAPNGRLGFDPDAVIEGTVGGSSVRDFLADEIADGKDGESIWQDLLAGNDVMRANESIRFIRGYAGDDLLIASPVSDTSLYGDAGDDVLVSRPNYYSNYGGDGADTFVVTGTGRGFRPSISMDFEHRVDTIALDRSAFQELGARITKQNFVLGTSATDADDRLIVNNLPRSNQADVFFDRDGSGPAAQVLIGHVTTDRQLRRGDFSVVHASDFLPDHTPVPASAHEPLIANRHEVMFSGPLAHFDLNVHLF